MRSSPIEVPARRYVARVGLGIEVAQLLALNFVFAEVEIGAAVYAFELLEPHGELELDVTGCVGIAPV